MRRAVRDYKFEVNENRMTEECVQYLTQLQKDWERHRVKLGVEAIKKEVSSPSSIYLYSIAVFQISERDRDRESISSSMNDAASIQPPWDPSAYQSIDMLFDRTFDKSLWEPPRPPQALGELLDSRFMIPLLFPSDPRLLAALPGKILLNDKQTSTQTSNHAQLDNNTTTPQPGLSWRSRNRRIRDVGVQILRWVDGANSASKWGRALPHEYEYEREDKPFIPETRNGHQIELPDANLRVETHEFVAATPLTRRPSQAGRAKARYSISSIDQSIDRNTEG